MTGIELFRTMEPDQNVWLNYNNDLFHLNHSVRFIIMDTHLPLGNEVKKIKSTKDGIEVWL